MDKKKHAKKEKGLNIAKEDFRICNGIESFPDAQEMHFRTKQKRTLKIPIAFNHKIQSEISFVQVCTVLVPMVRVYLLFPMLMCSFEMKMPPQQKQRNVQHITQ